MDTLSGTTPPALARLNGLYDIQHQLKAGSGGGEQWVLEFGWNDGQIHTLF